MFLLISILILVCAAVKEYRNLTKHGISLFSELESKQKVTQADFQPWTVEMKKCIRKRMLPEYMGYSLTLIYTNFYDLIPQQWESALFVGQLHRVVGILTMSALMFVIAAYIKQFKKIHFLNDHPESVKLTYEDTETIDFDDVSKPIDKICAYVFLYASMLLGVSLAL